MSQHQDWQYRVMNEQIQLQEKLAALTKWLDANMYRQDIARPDITLLCSQHAAMSAYNGILLQRIARFGVTECAP